MKTLRLLVLDEHAGVRRTLSRRLSAIPGFKVVASTGDAQEALDKIADLHPDLVLMDIRMRQSAGLDVCRRVASASPGVRVAILTSYADVSDLRKAQQAGACGYLLKDLDMEKLAGQIRELAGAAPAQGT